MTDENSTLNSYLTKQNSALTSEIEKLKEKLSQNQNQIKDLTSQVSTLKTESAELSTTSEEYLQNISTLKSQLAESTSLIENFKQEKSALVLKDKFSEAISPLVKPAYTNLLYGNVSSSLSLAKDDQSLMVGNQTIDQYVETVKSQYPESLVNNSGVSSSVGNISSSASVFSQSLSDSDFMSNIDAIADGTY